LSGSSGYHNERCNQIKILLKQGPQGPNSEQRVDVARSEKDHTYDRLQCGDRKGPEIGVVRDDHAAFGVCPLQQCGILGANQPAFSHLKYVATSLSQIRDDVPVEVLIREDREFLKSQELTSAEIRTSFSMKRAA